MISARLGPMTTADALELLDKAAIANARLNSVTDFLDHPSLAHRNRWRDLETPTGIVRTLLPPTTIGGVVPVVEPVPALGAHTDAILDELGYPDAERDSLQSRGIV
jgi:formyl-CoA transferase